MPSIPLPPAPWVPTATHAETHLFPDATMDALNDTFVRFLDQNGDPLPAGTLVTIVVNTDTGEIDDITFEEAE